MSVQDYKEGLISSDNDVHHVGTDVQQSGPGTQATQDVPRKGFRDITVIQTNDMMGGDEEIKLTSEYYWPQSKRRKKKQQKERQKYDDCAVCIRRIVHRTPRGDMAGRTELVIQSKPLCAAFREIVGNTYDSIDINSTPIKIPAPFYELFFKRDIIRTYGSDSGPYENLRDEFKHLDDFISNDKLTVRNHQEYESLIGQNMISCETLWTLFPPNELLIRNDGEAPECWICRDIAQDGLYWSISGVRLAFDGRKIGLTKERYPISFQGRVNGTMYISDLPLLPVRYFRGWNNMRKRLEKRGEKFKGIMRKDLDGHTYRHYQGPLWGIYGVSSAPTSKINQRVVVDYKGYLDYHVHEVVRLEDQGPIRRSKSKTVDSDSDSEDDDTGDPSDTASPEEGDENSDEDVFTQLLNRVSERYDMRGGKEEDLLLLCPARIPAYALKAKEWGWVLLDELQEVCSSSDAFDSLQVDADTKSLIKSLVHGHSVQTDDFDDVIPGKGKGLVLLLGGNPGIGKTLTAESISELHGRPLYNVSAGELSVNVTNVEKGLQKIFHLGKRWNAIILLDEADVVMSKRSNTDLERNAIVAVWLRMLDYFEGVLFLTSNLTENLDTAFLSRIHLRIDLPDLTNEDRSAIWKNILKFNTKTTQESSWTPEMLAALGKLNVNGREIKNLLVTANRHACSFGESLSLKYLYDVVKVELSRLENIREVLSELERLLPTNETT
ncbi:uncharacterized protein LTHEOB_11864 [Lasiodiplodia theobromae]|uniref:uncharacterized protein n=1 Tax=Lasiodiplodia theobromae TaxID=45133 RepID=UPI0015C3035B|nr:uncharacterized protein LTHEOB_11864 [Lasiodiplodia theobromae]KAF4536857.1 hypothetical protein LTHEOB_11864 [Lasiodiplodia theobromae]